MTHEPRPPRDIADVIADLDDLRQQLSEVVNGNSHAGLRNLLDDIYGNEQRQRRGLIPRVVAVEARLNDLHRLRERDVTLLRGVALGVGYVVASHTGLVGLFTRMVGIVVN